MENNFYKNLKNAEQIINDAKRYQFRYNQLLNNGNISKLVKDTLPLTTIYGLPVFNLLGKNIRLKFYLTKGDLYAFWISPWATGESRGYTAGGGPGLSSNGIDIKDE